MYEKKLINLVQLISLSAANIVYCCMFATALMHANVVDLMPSSQLPCDISIVPPNASAMLYTSKTSIC